MSNVSSVYIPDNVGGGNNVESMLLGSMMNGGGMGERDDYNYRGGDMGERRWGNQYGRGYTRGSYGDRMTPPYYDPIYG